MHGGQTSQWSDVESSWQEEIAWALLEGAWCAWLALEEVPLSLSLVLYRGSSGQNLGVNFPRATGRGWAWGEEGEGGPGGAPFWPIGGGGG